jgi:hypothetical protein
MIKARLLLVVILGIILPVSVVSAKGESFSVGTYLGVHRPALEDLNDGEFKSSVGGFATITDAESGKNTHPRINFVNTHPRINFVNPLPDLGMGVNAGLEFKWLLNKNYSFVTGVGTWEASSRATTSGAFALQGQTADVVAERLAKVSYNEFYFGFHRTVIDVPQKYKAYYLLTLNEMFDIDYREDLVFGYVTEPAVGVKKAIILQSQATGLIGLQPGFGADYYFRDWLSVGMDASYFVGFKRVTFRDGDLQQSFLGTDNLTLWLPQRVSPETGDLQSLNHDYQTIDDYKTMRIIFDGWKLLFRMNMYF